MTETNARSPARSGTDRPLARREPAEAWYFPFGHRPQGGELAAPAPVKNLPPLSDPACLPLVALLTDPACPRRAQQVKFDWQVLRRAGVELARRHVGHDARQPSSSIPAGAPTTSTCCRSSTSGARCRRTWMSPGSGKGEIPFAEVPVAAAAAYGGERHADVARAARGFAPGSTDTPMGGAVRESRCRSSPVLADMEWAGVTDRPRAASSGFPTSWSADLEQLRGRDPQVAGEEFNINSPPQLAAILFDKPQLPVLKKTATGPSTDASVLAARRQGHELPAAAHGVPRAREAREHLHRRAAGAGESATPGGSTPRFNQTVAATGRLSSSDPNLQNIPIRASSGRDIRRGFVPREGWSSSSADYSQIELRLLAHLSGDPAFVEAFQPGGDIHRQTAALIFGVPLEQVTPEMRARAKTINFATIYGQGAARAVAAAQDRARRGEGVHRRSTSSASRACASTSTRRSSSRASTATWRRSSAAAATSPSCATATSTSARSASATRRELADPGIGGGPDQDRDDPHPRALRARRARQPRCCCRCTTSCVFEVPAAELDLHASAGEARDGGRGALRCRWWWISAWGRTGSTRRAESWVVGELTAMSCG